MSPIVICLVIVVIAILALIAALITGAFDDPECFQSGCGCIVVLVIGVIAIIFIVNTINSGVPSFQNAINDLSINVQENIVEPTTSFMDHLFNNILIPLCLLVLAIIGLLGGGYAFVRYKRSTAQTQISIDSLEPKQKNKEPIVGADGELLTPSQNEMPQTLSSLSFTGKNALKTVPQEFNLEKGMYRVDYKVPAETGLTVKIINLASGASNFIIHMEKEDGSTVYNNSQAGRFVLEVELSKKSSATWSVNFTALK